MIVRAVKALIF